MTNATHNRAAHPKPLMQYSSRSSSGGSSPDYVMVTADCISGLGCAADKLTLSGGTGNFSGSAGGSTVSIMKGYNGALGGRYSYTVRVQYKKYCSGSFNVSGNKANVYLSIYSDGCRIASVSEH